jgi:hypothetical protein
MPKFTIRVNAVRPVYTEVEVDATSLETALELGQKLVKDDVAAFDWLDSDDAMDSDDITVVEAVEA